MDPVRISKTLENQQRVNPARAARRFYWDPQEKYYSISARTLQQATDSETLSNPLVLAAICAGVIGVTVIIVIIVGVWIRSKLYSHSRSHDTSSSRQYGNDSSRSSTSTLDYLGDETQFDSVILDDSNDIFSDILESVTIDAHANQESQPVEAPSMHSAVVIPINNKVASSVRDSQEDQVH